MNNETEIWRDVVGYEGLYQVSSMGSVKSLERFVKSGNDGRLRRNPSRVLKLVVSIRPGYAFVGLCGIGNPLVQTVHRIVAEAFIPNPENKRTVNHIDGNKLNNKVENLEWATDGENIKHAYDTGLNYAPSGTNHTRTKLTESDVLKIRSMRADGHTFKHIASLFGVGKKGVECIAKRRTWKHI